MCVLTIYPDKENFIITSSRDESALRQKATPPAKRIFNGQEVLAPFDPEGGGSWLAVNNKERFICLLNGAFKPHEHTPPYRKSRGLIVMDAVTTTDIEDFIKNYDLNNIEPFTLVIIDLRYKFPLLELRWDGEKRYHSVKDISTPQIWSSAQLYPIILIEDRQDRFHELRNHKDAFSKENLLNFHLQEKYDHTILKKGNNEHKLNTLSISQLQLNNESVLFNHYDLMKDMELRKESLFWK